MARSSDLKPWNERPASQRQQSLSVQELWSWQDDPDNMNHRWSNYCLSCKAEDYEPYSPQLLHYCIKCGQECTECGYPKPIYAFPYNYESDAYKAWQIVVKSGRAVGRAPREAHSDVCNHCTGRRLDEEERLAKEANNRIRREMIESPEAQDALKIMMGN